MDATQISDSQPGGANSQTLDLLREALEYLCALPPHPMTRALAQRINAHLEDPTVDREQAIAKRALELEARRSIVMSNIWKPNEAGVPTLVVALAGDELTISSPRSALLKGSSAGKQLALSLAKDLADGVEIKLDKGHFWTI